MILVTKNSAGSWSGLQDVGSSRRSPNPQRCRNLSCGGPVYLSVACV
jgi:hypothetical protein